MCAVVFHLYLPTGFLLMCGLDLKKKKKALVSLKEKYTSSRSFPKPLILNPGSKKKKKKLKENKLYFAIEHYMDRCNGKLVPKWSMSWIYDMNGRVVLIVDPFQPIE